MQTLDSCKNKANQKQKKTGSMKGKKVRQHRDITPPTQWQTALDIDPKHPINVTALISLPDSQMLDSKMLQELVNSTFPKENCLLLEVPFHLWCARIKSLCICYVPFTSRHSMKVALTCRCVLPLARSTQSAKQRLPQQSSYLSSPISHMPSISNHNVHWT